MSPLKSAVGYFRASERVEFTGELTRSSLSDKATFMPKGRKLKFPKPKDYPFEDFRRQLQDVTHRRFVRDLEDQEASFVANVLKIRDYLSEFYDADDLPQKLVLFVEMYRHIATNAEAYDIGLLGIRDDDGIHASDALQYAVHWYFTSKQPSEWDSPNAIAEIKAKANEWKSNDV